MQCEDEEFQRRYRSVSIAVLPAVKPICSLFSSNLATAERMTLTGCKKDPTASSIVSMTEVRRNSLPTSLLVPLLHLHVV